MSLQSGNCKITYLTLWNNNIGPEGTKFLSTALQSPEETKYLADALQSQNCKITNLNLVNNNIGDEGTKFLSTALQHQHNKITQLNSFERHRPKGISLKRFMRLRKHFTFLA
jgi:Ran GTPase-activating protein (RanGAP) involved in mRNA processing and transport